MSVNTNVTTPDGMARAEVGAGSLTIAPPCTFADVDSAPARIDRLKPNSASVLKGQRPDRQSVRRSRHSRGLSCPLPISCPSRAHLVPNACLIQSARAVPGWTISYQTGRLICTGTSKRRCGQIRVAKVRVAGSITVVPLTVGPAPGIGDRRPTNVRSREAFPWRWSARTGPLKLRLQPTLAMTCTTMPDENA